MIENGLEAGPEQLSCVIALCSRAKCNIGAIIFDKNYYDINF